MAMLMQPWRALKARMLPARLAERPKALSQCAAWKASVAVCA